MKYFNYLLSTCAALTLLAGPALAFDTPKTAEVVKKVKRSVIRVQGTSIDTPVAFMPGEGGGSGVVFQLEYDQGVAYALTNHHVSGDSPVSSVRFWDGAEYKAEMIAREPGIDVALLKITGIPDERNLSDAEKTIIAAPLGDSDRVQIGDHAVAMGAPGSWDGVNQSRDDPWQGFMLQQTVTDGTVTGRDTVIEFPIGIWRQNNGYRGRGMGLGMQYGTNFPYAFRITVPINGGNSGGPLFNDRGEVIGLNFYGGSFLLAQNLNHTVPINSAKDFAFQILNTGKFEKPWLGLDVLMPPFIKDGQTYTEFKDKRKREGVDYIEVFDVRRDSAAQRAGFRKGDIILSVDGRRFASPEELRIFIFNQQIGTRLAVEVKRGGARLREPIVVEVQPKRLYDSEFSV